MTDLVLGELAPVEERYWEAVRQGRLDFQRCTECANAWLPPREECPNCLSTAYSWEQTKGEGEIVSWVVYQVGYHPALEQRLPYNVAIIRLDEGPRLISNIVDDDLDEPRYDLIHVGDRVRLLVAERHGLTLPLFTLLDD